MKTKALSLLKEAIGLSTESGLFDELISYCGNPDSINDVCDAVDSLLKEVPVDSNIILSLGEKIFLHNADESETEFIYVSTVVKLVETGNWEIVMQFRNSNGEIEEYPSFVILELMRRMDMYTARFAEAAKRHRNIVQKRSQV